MRAAFVAGDHLVDLASAHPSHLGVKFHGRVYIGFEPTLDALEFAEEPLRLAHARYGLSARDDDYYPTHERRLETPRGFVRIALAIPLLGYVCLSAARSPTLWYSASGRKLPLGACALQN